MIFHPTATELLQLIKNEHDHKQQINKREYTLLMKHQGYNSLIVFKLGKGLSTILVRFRFDSPHLHLLRNGIQYPIKIKTSVTKHTANLFKIRERGISKEVYLNVYLH